MKKAVRNTLLATSLCFALGAAAVGICLNSGSAFAEEAAQTPIISTIPGASIRYPEKTQDGFENDGLRFSSTIDKTQYDQLISDGYTVTTGTFIVPWSYYATAELNEENCFTNPVYYWETSAGNYSVAEIEGKTLILNVEGKPYVPEGETDYRLNGSIIKLKDNSVLNRKFVGVGYIKYEKDDVTNYAFGTTDESNARSVAEVAQKAYYNQKGIDDTTRANIGEAYVQRYLDLYKAANGEYPTVEYTEKVSVEAKDGFRSVNAGVKTVTVETYDAKIPGTNVPAMLDGSAKVSTGYVYNGNTTSQSLSISEDDLFTLSPYTSDEGVVTKSTEWSVDGQSLCIDYSKANSAWQGFYGSNTLKVSGRYVSFVAYMEEGYPEFGGSAFWINGSASKEAVFVLEPGVPKRVEIDLGGFSTVNAFAFQQNARRTDCKLFIDDVRFYDKTVDSVPYNIENLPVSPISITEDNILSLGSMYEGTEGAVTKSTEWSVDGKSESLCFDFSKKSREYWMGVTGNAYSWGTTTRYISFVAYCEDNYVTPNNAFWITTVGGGCDVDFSLTGGVPKKIVVPVSGSGVSLFTFQYNSVNSNSKLYIDDIIVYNDTAETKVPALDVTDKVASATEWSYHGTADGSVVVTKDEKSQAICIDFSNITDANTWAGVNLNGYDLGATYKYLSFTAYCEQDYSMANALWISDAGQITTIYTGAASEFALSAGVAKTFEWNYNSNKLSIFSLKPPTDKNCKIYISNIQFYNYKEEGSNPGLHTQTFVNGDKTTVVAGFTNLITSADTTVSLTMSIQTENGGEWTTIATEATKCALSQTVDLSALTYCKVKVVATSQGVVLSTQVVDLIPSAT